jgi:hypothetical protein
MAVSTRCSKLVPTCLFGMRLNVETCIRPTRITQYNIVAIVFTVANRFLKPYLHIRDVGKLYPSSQILVVFVLIRPVKFDVYYYGKCYLARIF